MFVPGPSLLTAPCPLANFARFKQMSDDIRGLVAAAEVTKEVELTQCPNLER